MIAVPKTLAGRGLVAVRFALGGIAWVAPKLLLKTLGAPNPDDPEARWMARMFAVRDAVLGVGIVCTKGEHRRLWWRVGLACDLADLAGGVIAARHPTKRRLLLKFAPLIGASLGAAALKHKDV